MARLHSIFLLIVGFAIGLFVTTFFTHSSIAAPVAAAPFVRFSAVGRSSLQSTQKPTDRPQAQAGRLDGIRPIAFVFVTGCTGEYQEFQAALVEWSWDETGTEGTITRVVGGCKNKEQEEQAAKSPLQGDRRFEVFYAQGEMRYVPQTGKLYPYRGKPWSLMQWMDAGLPPWSKEKPPEMVVLLDPDFMLLRPLSAHPQVNNVRRGYMLASTFDMGGTFISDFPELLGEPIPEGMDPGKANNDYSSGPPWFIEHRDFLNIMPLWANYTDQLGVKRGAFLDEQFALLLSAVRNRVPMLPQGDLLSVSNPVAYREVWSREDDEDRPWRPYVMHYCIVHSYKGFYFHKSLLARKGWFSEEFDNAIPGVLSCDAPQLQEPPPPPSTKEASRNDRMTAWFLHRLIPRINAGMQAYRAKVCPAVEEPAGARARRFVRTISPVMCNGRKTSLYYVGADEGRQATKWEGNGIGGANVCDFQQ